MNYIALLWDWSMEARWRTWLFHSLFALVLTPILGGLPVIVLFFARELEQLLHDYMTGFKIDWVDHILDYAAPFTVVVLLYASGLVS